jgi:hypothetical protein
MKKLVNYFKENPVVGAATGIGVLILLIAAIDFLFTRNGVGMSGLEALGTLPFSFFAGVVVVGILGFFGIRALVRKYKRDGVNYGGIDLGIWLIALAIGLACVKGCEVKADSTVPRTEVNDNREAAEVTDAKNDSLSK